MAFYCELPNERICDIGWERLTCTEQWLEDQIREIQGYSREQRVRLGKECVNDVIRFLANMYKNDEAGTDSYLFISVCGRHRLLKPYLCHAGLEG